MAASVAAAATTRGAWGPSRWRARRDRRAPPPSRAPRGLVVVPRDGSPELTLVVDPPGPQLALSETATERTPEATGNTPGEDARVPARGRFVQGARRGRGAAPAARVVSPSTMHVLSPQVITSPTGAPEKTSSAAAGARGGGADLAKGAVSFSRFGAKGRDDGGFSVTDPASGRSRPTRPPRTHRRPVPDPRRRRVPSVNTGAPGRPRGSVSPRASRRALACRARARRRPRGGVPRARRPLLRLEAAASVVPRLARRFPMEEAPAGPPPPCRPRRVFTVIVDDLVFPDATKMGCWAAAARRPRSARAHPSDLAVGPPRASAPTCPKNASAGLTRGGRRGPRPRRRPRRGVRGRARARIRARVGRRPLDARLGPFPVSILPHRARTVPPHPALGNHRTRRPPDAGVAHAAGPDLYAMLRPPASALPPAYLAARAFHVGVHPERPDLTSSPPSAPRTPRRRSASSPSPPPRAAPSPRRRRVAVPRVRRLLAERIGGGLHRRPRRPEDAVNAWRGWRAGRLLATGRERSAAYDARAGSFSPRRRFTGSGRGLRPEGAVADVTGCGNASAARPARF